MPDADHTPARPTLRQHLRDAHGLSASDQKRVMQVGRVRLRGVPTSDGGRQIDPETVEFLTHGPRLRPGRDLAILHQDPDVVVVWKPAELLSVPARSHPEGHLSAIGLVGRLLGRVYPVHRLDRDTTGVMVFARTPAAQDALKQQLEARTMQRRYLALLARDIGDTPRRIDMCLIRDRGDTRRGAVPNAEAPPDALAAVTHLRRLERVSGKACLVAASLESGRTHQVRLHAEAIGHPLLGDTLYAPMAVARLSPRLALHAAVLAFEHPTSGEVLRFETELADDLEQLRRSLLHNDADPRLPNRPSRPKDRKGSRPGQKRRQKRQG